MIKRVNFTGRRRIPRDRVKIEVYDGNPRTFDATIDLDGSQLLPHAAVFLEAACAGSTAVQRFDFGEVGDIQDPRKRELSEIEGENVFFSLKVVDRTERFGRILGIAENIRPKKAGKQTASGHRGILPIEQVDLGHELWKLEFREHDVFLLVNRTVPGLIDRARSDPSFYAAIYPEIVRKILARAIDENADADEDDDRWPVMWLRFGKGLHPARLAAPSSEDQDEIRQEWVDEVVSAFCEAHTLREKYISATTNGDGG